LQTGKGYCANLGHQEDETGFIYMRARYYEPTTGRFISEDPARDGVNWYLYADGNPVNRVDADGKEAIDSKISAAIVGFIIGFILAVMEGLANGEFPHIGKFAYSQFIASAAGYGAGLAMQMYLGAAGDKGLLERVLKSTIAGVGGGIGMGVAAMAAFYAGWVMFYCMIDMIENLVIGSRSGGIVDATGPAPPPWWPWTL
jgi:RHS repeat-associated protein